MKLTKDEKLGLKIWILSRGMSEEQRDEVFGGNRWCPFGVSADCTECEKLFPRIGKDHLCPHDVYSEKHCIKVWRKVLDG